MDKPVRCERRYPHKYSPIECSYQNCLRWVDARKCFVCDKIFRTDKLIRKHLRKMPDHYLKINRMSKKYFSREMLEYLLTQAISQ